MCTPQNVERGAMARGDTVPLTCIDAMVEPISAARPSLAAPWP
jgi:hypothetical protein